MPLSPAVPLSRDQVAAYQRDGFLVVPDLYDAGEMHRWKAAIRAALATDPQKGQGPDSGIRVWMSDEFPPDLLPAMRGSALVGTLNQLIGPDVEFLSAKAVFKDGRITYPSPWHQDWHYWGGAAKLSVWVAVDDAGPENGCLKVIPGSHRMTFEHRRHAGQVFGNRLDEAQLEGLPVISAAVKRGGAIFFHDLLVHSSHPNTSGQDRMSFIATYRDASVADDSTVWPTSLVVSGRSVNPPSHSTS